MTAEERKIHDLWNPTPDTFFSTREIIRHVAGKGARSEVMDLVITTLKRMVRLGILEKNNTGHYRIKPKPKIEAGGRHWVSPEIAKLLKQSDRDFSESATIEIAGPDEEPET